MTERICPRCNKPYIGYPAVSRHGHGDICPQCGKEEAFLDAGFSLERAAEMAAQVQRLEDEVSLGNQTVKNQGENR